jgi:hypothetical protein
LHSLINAQSQRSNKCTIATRVPVALPYLLQGDDGVS